MSEAITDARVIGLNMEFNAFLGDDSQERIVKALHQVFNQYGKDRFIREMAATIRSMKRDHFNMIASARANA